MTLPDRALSAAIAMLVLLSGLLAASVLAQQAGPRLGAVLMGPVQLTADFFPKAGEGRFSSSGPFAVDIEILALDVKAHGILNNSPNTTRSKIRYKVTDSRSDSVVFDRVIDAAHETPDAGLLSFSDNSRKGIVPSIQKNLAMFFEAYAAASGLTAGTTTAAAPPPLQTQTTETPVSTTTALVGLASGVPVTGDFRTGPFQSDGSYIACYALTAPRGSIWSIALMHEGKSYLPVFVSTELQCNYSNKAYLGRPDLPISQTVQMGGFLSYSTQYTTTAQLRSGGGTYMVVVSGQPAKHMKNYRLTVTRLPGTAGGQLAPNRAEARARLAAAAAEARQNTETASATASTASPRNAAQAIPGSTLRDCPDVCPDLVVLPAGAFMMGSSAAEADRAANEGPRHRVVFAHPFAVGKAEITGAEWDACVSSGGCPGKPVGGGRRPIVNVTWFEARAYAEWLSGKTGERYFLLSEAEWEYAARAGTDTPWNTGDAIITDDANILDSFKQAVPVGGFPPNAFGLYDMHGNVAEWVLDCIDIGYFGVPADGSAAVTANCPNRAYRGGYWAAAPKDVRSAARSGTPPATRAQGIGFRVGRAL